MNQQRLNLLYLLAFFIPGVLLMAAVLWAVRHGEAAHAGEIVTQKESNVSKNPAVSDQGKQHLAAEELPRKASTHAPIVDPKDLPELGTPFKLPNPSSMNVAEYEELLFNFLNERKYQKLGWITDKKLRDTGPFINGSYYGTHPAVRVYYSPGVIRWLAAGRTGTISDGEMIIKEQYDPPAARYDGKDDEELWKSLKTWTIMVKDSAGSHDGWYWGNPVKDGCVIDNTEYAFDHPITGFGHYCVRCHASTQSPNATSPGENNEFTFIAMRNIKGFPGEPVIFRVDDSWRETAKEKIDLDEARLTDNGAATDDDGGSHPKCTQPEPPERTKPVLNQEFVDFYANVDDQKREDVLKIPPITQDWVVQQAGGNAEFVTSNQCMSCHAGLTLPYGPSMFHKIGDSAGYGDPGWHIAPYGEWRWTPMGLAGRDPVFYAQMESELAIIEKEFAEDTEQMKSISSDLQNTCLRCHGAMGKHQHDADVADATAAGKKFSYSEKNFSLDLVHAVADEKTHIGHGDSKYGALARDGVSCMVCHRSQPLEQPADDDRSYLEFYLETSVTGNLHFGPANELYGPYKDDEISPYVMEHAMKIKPKHSDYIKSSRMCGSCHVVNLPVLDDEFREDEDDPNSPERVLANAESTESFKKFHHHVEQATYLEWLNSDFENEFNQENPNAQSCQDCHMSKGLKDDRNGIDIAKLQTRIAAVQDATYPEAENLVAHDQLNIRMRDEYSRHNFAGLNVFLLELFEQYDDILGVRKTDFMTGGKHDLRNSIEHMLNQAKYDTASLTVETRMNKDRQLTTNVVVTNKAGHRFPSGVGFRRAFVELLVIEEPEQTSGEETGKERIVWSSGRTNKLGVLIGADGKPLPTELFDVDAESEQQSYQKHHEIITSPDQVQVYETLLWDNSGKFTTSFVHGCITIKDNRLLPRGWKKEGPAPDALKGYFLRATWPGKNAKDDPRYQDGSGTDKTTYKVTLPADIATDRVKVRATLYYQAMPPYFLQSLFKTAPERPATQRLHHMLSNMSLDETPIKDWKLPVVSAESKVD